MGWHTVYKTVELHRALYAARSKPKGIAMRSVTVWVRHPELPEHKIDPKELIDQDSPYFHDVQFPRRSGVRGNLRPVQLEAADITISSVPYLR